MHRHFVLSEKYLHKLIIWDGNSFRKFFLEDCLPVLLNNWRKMFYLLREIINYEYIL